MFAIQLGEAVGVWLRVCPLVLCRDRDCAGVADFYARQEILTGVLVYHGVKPIDRV